MTMKIAFGATLLDKGLLGEGIDGIGQYCRELLGQFDNHPHGLELSPYSFGVSTSPSSAKILPNYSSYLAKSLLRINPNSDTDHFFNGVDLVHSTDQLIPIVRNKPLVATVMDTIPLSHPQFIKAQSRFLKPYLWKKLTQRADHIITISEFSKGEIIEHMGFPEEKITSIPLGVDARYFDKIPEETRQAVLKKFQLTKPFFLSIGSIQPRKNLLRLIQAHASLPNNLATEFPIVIAGKLAWDDGQTIQEIHRAVEQKRCVWVNYVGDFEKRCLLQTTIGMVLASLYEGFGLPILEGFASEALVITSNATSMPEVAGQAALLVDPNDSASIREALFAAINDQELIKELRLKGASQAKKFTWANNANETIKIYKTLL